MKTDTYLSYYLQAIEVVSCSFCGSGIGQLCKTSNGLEARDLHANRAEAFLNTNPQFSFKWKPGKWPSGTHLGIGPRKHRLLASLKSCNFCNAPIGELCQTPEGKSTAEAHRARRKP